jgi:hypothetical protein
LKERQEYFLYIVHHIVALKRKVVPPLLPKTPWLEAVKKLSPLEGCKRIRVIIRTHVMT